MKIAMLLYDRLTMLDLVGPYEILCRLPDSELCFVAKKPGQIPINKDLEEVFKEIRREQGLRLKYVFTYYGRNIAKVDKAFKGAVKRAGIVDFRFHDLRHTFASHFLMRGGTLKELQEILRHKSLTMTMRYAHLSQEHKKKAINLLNGLTAPTEKPADDSVSQNVTFLNPSKKHHRLSD